MSPRNISVRQLGRMLKATQGEQPFATIKRYWHDPAFAAAMDAEREVEQRNLNAMLDASIARVRAERSNQQEGN